MAECSPMIFAYFIGKYEYFPINGVFFYMRLRTSKFDYKQIELFFCGGPKGKKVGKVLQSKDR